MRAFKTLNTIQNHEICTYLNPRTLSGSYAFTYDNATLQCFEHCSKIAISSYIQGRITHKHIYHSTSIPHFMKTSFNSIISHAFCIYLHRFPTYHNWCTQIINLHIYLYLSGVNSWFSAIVVFALVPKIWSSSDAWKFWVEKRSTIIRTCSI